MHRLATLQDLDSVYDIYMQEEVIPFLGFDPMPRSDFVKILEELIASRSFFVVERDGRVQGFYKTSRHQGRARHVAYLGTFAVTSEARGTGLAKSIFEEAIARLQSEGVTRVELMVEADNPRALQFYRKLGFVLEGTMRAAYRRSGEDHYVDEHFMARLLHPLRRKEDA